MPTSISWSDGANNRIEHAHRNRTGGGNFPVSGEVNQRLNVIRPVLPYNVNELELRGIKISEGSVDLNFCRRSDDVVEVEVRNRTGGVEVNVELQSQFLAA